MKLSLIELIVICSLVCGNKVCSGESRHIFFTTSGSISKNDTHQFSERKELNHRFYNFVRKY